MGGFRNGPVGGHVPWVMAVFMWALPSPAWSCDTQLNPQAFQSSISNSTDLLPNGMMAIRHLGTNKEASPHVSVHRVMMTLPGRQLTIPETKDPEYLVVEVDGTIGWMTYLVAAHALFYGVGQDGLGFPERMWVDSEEDGINGNEHLNRHD